MDGLTPLQDKCLRLIQSYVTRERRPPTRRELCRLMSQRSTNGVNQVLDALEKKGYLKTSPRNRPRNIEVLRVPPKQLSLGDEFGSTQENDDGR